MKARGLEVGAFLAWFIKTEHVPAPSAEPGDANASKQLGGVSLLAWSSGNCSAMSLFAHAALLPKEDQELLNKYLRSYIVFGEQFADSFDNLCILIFCGMRRHSKSRSGRPHSFAISSSAFQPFTRPHHVYRGIADRICQMGLRILPSRRSRHISLLHNVRNRSFFAFRTTSVCFTASDNGSHVT